MATLILFPNQLISKLPNTEVPIQNVILVEHPVFYNNQTKHRPAAKLNQLRCVYTRVTQDLWMSQKETQWRPEATLRWSQLKSLKSFQWFPKQWIQKETQHIYIMDPVDSDLETETLAYIHKSYPNVSHSVLESPLFIFDRNQLSQYVDSKGGDSQIRKVLNHTSFYSWSRKSTGVLMRPDGKTEGGKLSLDTANRQSLSRKAEKEVVDSYIHRWTVRQHSALTNALKWVKEELGNHYGLSSNVSIRDVKKKLQWFALDERQASSLLTYFVKHKLQRFGTYQDAIASVNSENSLFLYHSNLSHCLNNGLLSVTKVIERVQKWYYKTSSRTKTDLAQAEGFLRQVIGWREFTRLGAWKYRDHFWNANGLKHQNKLSSKWYEGRTGCKPIDATIKKGFDTGYLHHIERLMIMGNYMTLSQIHPREMYQWFMEFAMDSYDWVMILNVFGMAAHADLGVSFTKPYISSSNYVLKMSHYPKDSKEKGNDAWNVQWDALYYKFLNRHKTLFQDNPRMALMMRGLNSERAKSLLSF